MINSRWAVLVAAIFLTIPAFSEDNPTAALLVELIRIDTSNPPGQEGKLAELLASKFRPLGIDVTIVPTSQPGKTHFIARLKGDGAKKPVLLAAHADVVGVEREKWTLDPFAGVIKDGYVYGRGAIDFKGGIAVFAQAVMMLAKNHIPLHRDVIFLSEADEEGGLRYSTTWLAENHWDLINCEFALNEGGWVIKNAGDKVQYVSVSTADKSSIPLALTATGTSTHSSMPRPDSAIFTLSKALAKLADYDTQPHLIPSTREFFLTLAKTSSPPMSTYFNNLLNSNDPKLVHEADVEISKDPLLHAIMGNTIAPVFLNAGFRGNLIPGSAQATLNLRVLTRYGPAGVSVRDSSGGKRSASRSRSTAGRFREPGAAVIHRYGPVPRACALCARGLVRPGDKLLVSSRHGRAWRSRGVPVYGIYPYPISAEDLTRMHGNDERVPVSSLEQGTQVIYKTLLEVAAK